MTTDKKLNISSVSVLHADKVPSAKGLKIYNQFIGQAVNKVSISAKTSLEKAVQLAVKRAGMLLYVRLKGA